MVNIDLYKCCQECGYADLIQEETNYPYKDEELKDITIRCAHERVCHMVADYKRSFDNE